MKKIWLIIVLIFSTTLISSCVKDIEDTNGDSTALCYYTEQDILSGKYQITEIGSINSQVNNQYSYSVKKANGIQKLNTIKPKGQSVIVEVNLQILKGNAQLVLCNDDKIVYTFNEVDSFVIDPIYEELKLVLACESCELKLKYSLSVQ